MASTHTRECRLLALKWQASRARSSQRVRASCDTKRVFGALRLLCTALVLLLSAGTGSAESPGDGFRPLFNGQDFSGWYLVSGKERVESSDLFQVHDGMIHLYKDAEEGSLQPFGYLCTEEAFSDYHLRFQFKWGTKKFAPRADTIRDAGLLYHVIGRDGLWPKSVELQIQEGDTGDIITLLTRVHLEVDPATTNLIPKVVTNATTKVVSTNYSAMPHYKPASEGGVPFIQGVETNYRRVIRSEDYEVPGWNTVELIARGDSAVYIINGKTNNVIDKIEYMAGTNWVPLVQGKLLLQMEGAEVFYRNIEIKDLKGD